MTIYDVVFFFFAGFAAVLAVFAGVTLLAMGLRGFIDWIIG